MAIEFGREICADPALAEAREWLVTNRLGSYAAGTVAGMLSRSYHGLLIAALHPPVDRTLLVTKAEETVLMGGRAHPLSCNRWASGVLDPQGHRLIESFSLDGTIPTWRYAIADSLLEKRIWMQIDADSTYSSYRLIRASEPLLLELKVLVNHRSHHGGTTQGAMALQAVERGVQVIAHPGAAPFYLLSDRGDWRIEAPASWYEGFRLEREAERGLPCVDAHLHGAMVRVELTPQQPCFTFTASREPAPVLEGERALGQRQGHEREVLRLWRSAQPELAPTAPDWIQQLVLAADAFLVERPWPDGQPGPGASLLAGYPWFNDWGRDTMISLAGLTLVTGRAAIAERMLRTYAGCLSGGMLPNRFPDRPVPPDAAASLHAAASLAEPADYTTVDATLWFFQALHAHQRTTGSDQLIRELYPQLVEIIERHRRGTRHGIRLDPADGLLRCGEGESQLTWMDAKVNGKAVTPRHGKPVEVNALWINALRLMAAFAARLGQEPGPYSEMADRGRTGFQRFWCPELGHCFDGLDGPDGQPDRRLRPNQLLALSLDEPLLSPQQARSIVTVCAQRLLTSHGLRSLDPADPDYQGSYGGDPRQRDHAYHQGTVWGWLIGPFAIAYARSHHDPAAARQLLRPFGHHLAAAGLGSISEIFDGDPPHQPRGCIAQAWSVAEVLRAWTELGRMEQASGHGARERGDLPGFEPGR